jgi:hypothetical protein
VWRRKSHRFALAKPQNRPHASPTVHFRAPLTSRRSAVRSRHRALTKAPPQRALPRPGFALLRQACDKVKSAGDTTQGDTTSRDSPPPLPGRAIMPVELDRTAGDGSSNSLG